MNKDSKIFIIGHDCIIERSLLDYFKREGYLHVDATSTLGLDPSIQPSVNAYFQDIRPEYIFFASTRSGGIQANIEQPAEFAYHNMAAQNNVLYASWKFGIKKLLFYAGSCIYPKECEQPMKEAMIGSGPMEETSIAYSTAKLAGVRLCQAYRRQYGLNTICMIPATLYGPQSDQDLIQAHVMGALIGKFLCAKKDNQDKVEVWGSGQARREFLYIDDFIEASMHLMEHYDKEEPINVGCGSDVSIKELAQTIKDTTGYAGEIVFDTTKPEGALQKLLDSSQLEQSGFQAKTNLTSGITQVIKALNG